MLCWGAFAVSALAQPQNPQQPGNQPGAANQVGVGTQSRLFSLRFGGGRTDNFDRVPAGEESASYSLLGFFGEYTRTSARLDAAVTADLEERYYSDSSIDDEPYGYARASVELFAVPDRFSWVFADSYGQARTDPFRVAGPLNREQVNAFSTGPRFNIPLGARTAMRISATEDIRTYSETDLLDSDTTTVDLGIARGLDSNTEVGFVVASRETEYDVPALDNEVRSAFISYQRTLASGMAAIAVGASEAEFRTSDSSAPYVTLAWDRDVGARSRISLSASNELIDAGDSLRRVGDGTIFVGDAIDDLILTADLFEQTTANLNYSLTYDRSQLTFTLGRIEAAYENDVGFDNTRDVVAVTLSRTVAPLLSIGGDVYRGKRVFEASGQQDEDRRVSLWLQRLFGSRLTLDLRLERRSRDGVGVNNYTENIARAVFRYSLNRRAPI